MKKLLLIFMMVTCFGFAEENVNDTDSKFFIDGNVNAQSINDNDTKIKNDSNWSIRESITLSMGSGYYWDLNKKSTNGMILNYGIEVFLDKEKNWKINISNTILFDSNRKLDEEYKHLLNIYFKYYLNNKSRIDRYYLIGMVIPFPSLFYYNYGLGCEFKIINPISFKVELLNDAWIILSDVKPMSPLRIQLGILYNLNF